MTRRSLSLAACGVACLAAVAAAQSPAEVTLESKGLTREKATYVHATEKPALDKVEEVHNAYKVLRLAQYKLAEADQNTMMIAELNQQAQYLQQEKNAIAAQTRNLPRMPRGGGMIRRAMQSQVNAQVQQEQQAINATNQQIAAAKKAAPTPQARKAMEEDIAKRKDEMTQAVTEARKLIDESNAAYEALAKDASVKAALAQAKAATTDALKLGPSKEFHAAEKAIANAERMLGLGKAEATAKKGAKAKAKK